MKAIMVMFDSLNRRMLPPYGSDWTHAPNFARLAERTVTFENCYVGSMPCMPARRELHTGRYNFLHRSWGPLEPFDDSAPQILKQNDIYAHFVTDHYHYWEDGGATYHQRYSSFETSRGQEGDSWIGYLGDVDIPETLVPTRGGHWGRQDWVNRRRMLYKEENLPQVRTFKQGLKFINENSDFDNWFLQIETFDPHEPFYTLQKHKDLYPHEYDGPHFDWPKYGQVTETPEQVQHMRYEYAALLSMCDEQLGKVLDMMDEKNLWDDTLLIVNTDHGFLLGEHDHWAKCVQPFYNEVAHTPFFIWDPRCGRKGERCDSLVQTIDIPATLLEYFGVERPEFMHGIPLRDAVASNAHTRDAALFGMFGGHINITDGRYVYMRSPTNDDNQPLYNYTLMPTHMRGHFKPEEFKGAELAEPFEFTKNCPTVRTASKAGRNPKPFGTLLFDLENDPGQENPIQDEEVEARLCREMVRLMKENDAPSEQYERMGLEGVE
ncbi:MAG: sulfatase [Planctomycetota bacterium]|nr:sulfatase [Planctomycetota bacterium]